MEDLSKTRSVLPHAEFGRAAEALSHVDVIESLETAILACCDRHASRIADKSLRMNVVLPPRELAMPLAVRGDREALTEIAGSLLERAIASLSGGMGTVRVLVRTTGAIFEVTVEDNGKGLSEALLSKLETRGLGLGGSAKMTLEQMRELGARWGWNIELLARLGVGTRVTLELPRVDGKAALEADTLESERRREILAGGGVNSDQGSQLG